MKKRLLSILVLGLLMTGCSSNTFNSHEDNILIAKTYCEMIGEELDEMRIQTEFFNEVQFVCTQNIPNRNNVGHWMNIEEIQLQIEFEKIKKNKERINTNIISNIIL